MRNETEFVAFHRSHRCDATHRCDSLASLRRSLRYSEYYSGHAREIAGGHRQLEVLIDSLQPSEDGLPDASHRLAPAKVLFDALADRLAQWIARVTRGTPVDGTAAAPALVAGNMRRDV